MMVAYGHKGISIFRGLLLIHPLTVVSVAPEDDLFITLSDKAMDSVSVAFVPGAFMVEALHFC